MSEAKGTTVGTPRASQKELEAVLHRNEYETAGLRWALKKFNTRDMLEEFRGEMMRVESFLRVTGDQLFEMVGTNDDPNQQFFLSLSNTLTLYADMVKQKIEETDTCYLGKVHRQNLAHLLGGKPL